MQVDTRRDALTAERDALLERNERLHHIRKRPLMAAALGSVG